MKKLRKVRQWIGQLQVWLYVAIHRCPLMRMNNNWLYYRTYKELQKTKPELFPPLRKQAWSKLTGYIFSRQGWWIMMLLAFSPFVTTYLAPSFLHFIPIEAKTARELLEQRTGQLAALVSLALVVAGFLMNVMAGKNKLTTETLIRNSRIFPITVFSLSVVAYLIVLSTLRDVWVNNPSRFNDLFLAGSYMALGVIGLIGYLFFKVFSYIDSTAVNELNKKTIEKTLKVISRSIYLTKESHHLLRAGMGNGIDLHTGQRELLLKNEIENLQKSKSTGREYRTISISHNYNNSQKKYKQKRDTSSWFTNSLIIKDINITRLKGSLEPGEGVSDYLSFQGLHENADSVWISSSHFKSETTESELRKTVLIAVEKKKTVKNLIETNVYLHYKDNLIASLDEYNNEQLKTELESIEQFYNLLFREFQLPDKYIDPISSPITDLIIDLCIKTIQNKDERKTEEFLLFIDRIIRKAIDNYQVALMGKYLLLLVKMYEEIKKAMPQMKDENIDLASRIPVIFTSGFDPHLFQKVLKPDSHKVEESDALFLRCLTEYSMYLYKIIELNDTNLAIDLLKTLADFYDNILPYKIHIKAVKSNAYDNYIHIRSYIRYSLYFETISNPTLFNQLEAAIPVIADDVEDFLKKLTSLTLKEIEPHRFLSIEGKITRQKFIYSNGWMLIGYLMDVANERTVFPPISPCTELNYLEDYQLNSILTILKRSKDYLNQPALPWMKSEIIPSKENVVNKLEELIEIVTTLEDRKAVPPQVHPEETNPPEEKTTEKVS